MCVRGGQAGVGGLCRGVRFAALGVDLDSGPPLTGRPSAHLAVIGYTFYSVHCT